MDINENQLKMQSLSSEINIKLVPDLLEGFLILSTYSSHLMISYKISDVRAEPSAN